MNLPDHATLKLVHQAAVVLSIGGFFVRGIASLAGAPWVTGRLAKTVPHVVDTVLLASALTMAWMLDLSPTNAPWIASKIGGLVLYIVLGAIALRPGRSWRVRTGAWMGALVVVTWIVSVAITKHPLGFLAG